MTDNEWAATQVMGWTLYQFPSAVTVIWGVPDGSPPIPPKDYYEDWCDSDMKHLHSKDGWNPSQDRNQLWQVLGKLDEGQKDALYEKLYYTFGLDTSGLSEEYLMFNYFIDTPPAEVLRLVRETIGNNVAGS